MSQSPNHIREEVTGEQRLRSSRELSQMMLEGRSFSGKERNCVFFNTGAAPAAEGRFANISAASGLDFPDDGRAVALVDWDHDGDLDMWISNRNAPRLRLMRNDTLSNNHFLALRLEGNGKTTNRDAVGARVEVVLRESKVESRGLSADDDSGASGSRLLTLDSRPLIKTLRAGEGFLAQSSKWLHFGLGAADSIEKVIVHWPGGDREEFSDIHVDHRYRLVQGSGTGRDVTLPARETKLVAFTQQVAPATQVARVPMVELVTVPKCGYEGVDGTQRLLPTRTKNLLLVNLWASWCGPCLAELSELSRRYDEIRAHGIEVLALSVDGLGEKVSETDGFARLISSSKYPFTVGRATSQLLDIFQNLHNRQFPIHRRLPLPTSFLIDRHGRLAVIYKGALSIDALLEDVAHAEGSRLQRFARSAPIAGQPISHPQVAQTAVVWAARLRFLLAYDLQQAGRADEAAEHYGEVLKLMPDSAEAHINRGVALRGLGRLEEAATHYQEALRVKPDQADAHNNLGLAMQGLGRYEEATKHYHEALRIRPDYAEAYHNWGLALESLGRFGEAEGHYRDAVRIKPKFAEVHNSWGIVLAKQGRLEDAIKHFQQSVHLKPEYRDARINLQKAQSLLQTDNGTGQP